jgi:hypothetical protein
VQQGSQKRVWHTEALQVESLDSKHHSTLHFPAGVVATTDFAAACQGVSVAVMCGGVPRRGPGLAKAQLMAANCAIYRDQAAALAAYAQPGVKVRVDGSKLQSLHPKPMIFYNSAAAAAKTRLQHWWRMRSRV